MRQQVCNARLRHVHLAKWGPVSVVCSRIMSQACTDRGVDSPLCAQKVHTDGLAVMHAPGILPCLLLANAMPGRMSLSAVVELADTMSAQDAVTARGAAQGTAAVALS